MGRRLAPNRRPRSQLTRIYRGQQIFSFAQASALLGRHASTIYRLIEAGSICPVETPLGRRVSRVEVERLLGAPIDDRSHHIVLAADRLFAAEAELLAVERPKDRLICVTVRFDMDPGPNALPDHLRWSQERMRRPISSLI